MDIVVTTDLAHVARELGLPVDQVKRTVELLDEGNTVPFITRYRRDQTGGFDEQQVRRIQDGVTRARMLAERKQTILRSIDSQGKLDKDLAGLIKGAQSTKRLEDLYLPYKPKKQTLATTARERGLQPLADEVLAASPLAADLDLRAGDYLNPDLKVFSRADVLLGVGHLLAEAFSERADLRSKLRRIMRATGKLVSTRAVPPNETGPTPPRGNETPSKTSGAKSPTKDTQPTADEASKAVGKSTEAAGSPSGESPPETAPATPADQTAAPDAAPDGSTAPDAAQVETDTPPTSDAETTDAPTSDAATAQTSEPPATEPAAAEPAAAEPAAAEPAAAEPAAAEPAAAEPAAAEPAAVETAAAPSESADQTSPQPDADATVAPTPEQPGSDAKVVAADTPSDNSVTPSEPPPATTPPADAELPTPPAGGTMPSVAKAAPTPPKTGETEKAKREKRKKKKSKKEREKERREKAFKDYFDFREDLTRLLPHRILAVNRGERAKVLKVRIECDTEQMIREADKLLVPADHPHAEFLRGVLRDALMRLVLPSLEREVRRELTDKAEAHAVDVFARNLRHLLLSPPLHGRRVLAVDPGFRSGCKMAAIDEFGNVLGHGVIHFVGRDERRRKARYQLAEIIGMHRLSVVAIGNGTACREVEQLVADVIATELKHLDVEYCIVNEAGASVYSTSGMGREELPDYDATLRSAISIGRRLLDPLSELVKINPSNIGVGLYQHDVKAKHLRESLDAVVESCVNFVGVDVNRASPALLRYVSGLNQLTARRLYDYRLQNGPFKNREELRNVAGFGEATFVQAAGFLKIHGGDNPLDVTWIHPESYEVARQVLAEVNSSVSDLHVAEETATPPAPAAGTPTPVESAPVESAAAPTTTPSETPAAESAAESVPDAPVAPALTEPPPVAASPDLPADSEPAATEAPAAESPTADLLQEPPVTETPVAESSSDEKPADDLTVTPTSGPSAEEQLAAAPTSAEAAESRQTAASETTVDESPASAEPSGSNDASSAPAELSPAESAPAEQAPAEHAPPEQAAAEQSSSAPSVEKPTGVDIAKRMAEVNGDDLAAKLGIGRLLLRDVLAALARPGRDPRDDLPRPIFRRGIVKIDDLEPGMELAGTVLNVVDFGVFVDIGLNDSALIHVSRLADRFVRDPHDVVSVGDIIKVWVVDVDKQRRRVSLTAIKPGTERSAEERRGKRFKAKPKPTHTPRERAGSKRTSQGPRPGREGGRRRQVTPRAKPQYKPRPKPKPVVPITKAMKEGREPMRTFSDLQQFLQSQQVEEKKKAPPKDKKSPPKDKKPADESPKDVKPTDEKPGGEQPADEKPAGEKRTDVKPTDEQRSSEKPADKKPAGEQPSGEQPSGEHPTEAKPTDDRPNDEAKMSPEPEGGSSNTA